MNSELYDNNYKIPIEILNYIKSKLYTSDGNNDGVKKAKNLVNNGYCTYQNLKRLKNFFDHYNPETDSKKEYELSGGDMMRDYIEKLLNSERDRTSRSSQIKKDIGHDTSSMMSSLKSSTLTESKKKQNALAIIFNDNMEVLLLKRTDSYEEMWMPNKWALVGGGIEEGETPVEAVQREIKEETSLDIDKFIEKFTIEINDNVEYMFICKYNGSDTDVELNDEHTDYTWIHPNELSDSDLEFVPHLIEHIKLATEKYN